MSSKATVISSTRTHGADTADAMARVLAAADALLDQCQGFIRDLPEQVYQSPSSVLRGGTIGKHVRHVLDHYCSACVGLEASEPIDYDRRERGGTVESEVREALAEIERIRGKLATLAGAAGDAPVELRVMVASDGSEVGLKSSLAREIAFATHHAVHHQAMMRAIASEHGAPVSEDFGKAPSTLDFERRGC